MPGQPLLTTEEVATLLGVKPATVYAYVSRGLLTSRRNGSGKQSLFVKADVDAFLAGRKRVTTPEIQTGITLIKDGHLYYRWRHAPTLARTVSFEAVAELLWTGALREPGRPGDDERSLSGEPDGIGFPGNDKLRRLAVAVTAPLPDSARLTDRLRVIVAAAAAADPLRFDTTATAVVATGRQLIATMVQALPTRSGGLPLRQMSLAEQLWLRLTADPPTESGLRALNAALVLLADHDLAASTLAARVAASTRAHPYAVVSAGLAALDGPLHGAASSLSYAMLKEAVSGSDPLTAVSAGLRSGGPVPGFGHPLYPDGDPRATALFELIEDGPVRRTALELADIMQTRSGNAANIDLALAALTLSHHMPPDAGEAVFAVARTAGWLAHALEEYSERPSRFRPTGNPR
ncbi:citrate synthase [Actinoplanes italicus]|uniref:citrate synthase (unknown stereospecificity) n=1 Tax=Actinoplanes italicus TaxID=113567 RepID=A0A2T0K7N1_9ACTN|nr:citrate synthase [Actinoplanes italicus]PRX19005.1 citrate synthase [Actinoplanes italicus]GIE32416.1 citrate synthase [Actinoplanes italicus]